MTLKVYHVILHRTEDLDAFYADMETPGGYLHIPDRAVDYEARLPFSKVTAYRLTDEEAEEVRQDPRVRVVEPALEQHNIVAEPYWEQTSSYWRKDRSAASFTQRNWGLWQSTQSQSVTSSSGVPLSNFTSTATYADSGTVTLNAEGVNVDVIVVDGIPNLDHPEFAVNADGSGGSRIIQYNWFQHTDSVTGGTYSNGTYNYTTNVLGDSSNNNHGTHVMGTVAGNRQGWARKANLYSISPYSSNYNWSSTGISSSYVLDYVRAFHRNKAVNPETGRKNPTIINNSWGYNYGGYGGTISDYSDEIERIVYRGTEYSAPFTDAQVYNLGLPAYWALTRAFRDVGLSLNDRAGIPDARTSNVGWMFESPKQQTLDCIEDGIIVVSSAGNNSQYLDSENGPDYNNKYYLKDKSLGAVRAYYQSGDSAVFYHRGSPPGIASICVGNASIYSNNQRDFSSSFGPRTDIFAPGNEIMSSVRFDGIYDDTIGDDRALGSAWQAKISGTSMASPQVTGALACALQNNPDLTQAEAKAYLQGNAFKDIMFDSSLDWGDVTTYSHPALQALTTDLKNTPNYYLRYKEERYVSGVTVPKVNDKERPTSGLIWPRTRVIKTRRIIGDVLYPSAPPIEAPAEALLTYTGAADYTTVETYINDSSGQDYSPAYLGGYIGDFIAAYSGNYIGDYLTGYTGGDSAGTAFTAAPYIGAYISETADSGTLTSYLSNYISGETSYTKDYEVLYVGGYAGVTSYVDSELNAYTTPYIAGSIYIGPPTDPGNYLDQAYSDAVTYSGDYTSGTASYDVTSTYEGGYNSIYSTNYEVLSYNDSAATYIGGAPLAYVADYQSIDSGGGDIIQTTYLGSYVPSYLSGGAGSYIQTYTVSYIGEYATSFTDEFVGTGSPNTYVGDYTNTFVQTYTGNYVGPSYQGTYVGSSNTSLNVSNNSASNYIIDSASNPTLTLEKGTTYTFNLSVSGHPFWIKTAPSTGTGDQYNTGVTNNGAETGTLTFTVDASAPSTLYYICEYHGGMVGTINIVTAGSTDYVSAFTSVDQENYVGDFTSSFTGSYNA